MRELYALIVGEFGCDPRYFLREMSPNEAADYLEGARRRSRSMFEASRIGWWMQAMNTEGMTMQELFPFEWDPKPKNKRVTKRQRDDLCRRAAEIAENLSKVKNGE